MILPTIAPSDKEIGLSCMAHLGYHVGRLSTPQSSACTSARRMERLKVMTLILKIQYK